MYNLKIICLEKNVSGSKIKVTYIVHELHILLDKIIQDKS